MPDDRDLITAEQLEALRLTLQRPTVYTQRLVEHLTFVETGGQHWCREIQILLPKVEGRPDDQEAWFVVSLGMFRRSRFPDFSVADNTGASLSLLTRFQHGHCLSEVHLNQYLTGQQRRSVLQAVTKVAERKGDSYDENVRHLYVAVYQAVFNLMTSVSTGLEPGAADSLRELLLAVGAAEEEAVAAAELFQSDMEALHKVTQYLCWVRGVPGESARLTATFTMPDGADLTGSGPRPPEGQGLLTRLRVATQDGRSRRYARLGLAAVHYQLQTPAHDHNGSYYFTMKPPPDSTVAYLDWGESNSESPDEHEWACAHHSVHVHHGARLADSEAGTSHSGEITDSQIHAFVRLDAGDHKQVAFAALLNLAFVLLAESGQLVSELSGPATPWLVFTPAVLVAFVTQQRRHYYAALVNWIRAAIWIYLLLNVGFLVSISIDIADPGSALDRTGLSDDVVSVIFAAASLVVIVLFSAIGPLYSTKVSKWFATAREKSPGERPIDSYVRVARRYGNYAVGIAAAALVALALFLAAGLGSKPVDAPAVAPASTRCPQVAEAGKQKPTPPPGPSEVCAEATPREQS